MKQLQLEYSETVEITVESSFGVITVHAPKYSFFVDHISEHSSYEPLLVFELGQTLNADLVYYDIGAAYDFFTKLATRSGVPPESVHAFNTDSARLPYFTKTHGLEQVNITNKRIGSRTDRENNLLRLDDYNGPDPTVVKIGVKVAEYDILSGFTETLKLAGLNSISRSVL